MTEPKGSAEGLSHVGLCGPVRGWGWRLGGSNIRSSVWRRAGVRDHLLDEGKSE